MPVVICPFIENVETLISAWVQFLNVYTYKHGGEGEEQKEEEG